MSKRLFILLMTTGLFASCSNSFNDGVDVAFGADVESSADVVVVGSDEVAFSASTTSATSTRTAMDDIDAGTVKWVSGDKISLWGYSGDEAKISNLELEMCYYSTSLLSKAIFTGTMQDNTDSADVEYTYYAVHPVPDKVEDTTVKYEIPTVQNGRYEDSTAIDPMVATASKAGALQVGKFSDLELSFRHLAHMLRIEIPNERNYLVGGTIKKLRIDFPAAVSDGYLSFDYRTGDGLAFGGTSKTIEVELESAVSGEGDYVWVTIPPQTMSGDLTFRCFNESGSASKSITKTISNVSFGSGEITPITLTAPEIDLTNINVKITDNNLGENPNTVKFTAPDNALFYGGKSSVTFDYVNSKTYEYPLSYETYNYGEAFNGKTITVAYDSTNAAVSSSILLSSIEESCDNSLSTAVPYLLDEDFSSLSESGENETSTNDSLSGLPGWVAGNRAKWYAGECIDIRMYSWAITYESRFNSPTFASMGLKQDAKLKVTFNADWNKNVARYVQLIVGRSSGCDLDDTINNSTTLYDTEVSWTSGWSSYSHNSLNDVNVSESSTFTLRKVEIANCATTDRIVWKTDGKANGTFKYEHLYIDNVKVSIAN